MVTGFYSFPLFIQTRWWAGAILCFDTKLLVGFPSLSIRQLRQAGGGSQGTLVEMGLTYLKTEAPSGETVAQGSQGSQGSRQAPKGGLQRATVSAGLHICPTNLS